MVQVGEEGAQAGEEGAQAGEEGAHAGEEGAHVGEEGAHAARMRPPVQVVTRDPGHRLLVRGYLRKPTPTARSARPF